MSEYQHLEPEVRHLLTWPNPEREYYINQEKWVGYTRAQDILAKMKDLINHPKVTRMPNLLLVGASGNGKSTILSRFKELNPGTVTEEGDPNLPVILMDMPPEPNESRFWSELLNELKIAHRQNDKAHAKQTQAINTMLYANVRMLIIDEIHNLLHGSPKDQRKFMAVLKNLSNKLKLPIVLAGTRESILVMHTDTQMSSRFEVEGLPKWELNKEYLRLLASLEALIPLAKPSNLASKELALKIHAMSSGTLGTITKIIERAAIHAIKSGDECITPKTLDSIGWVKLSDYGKQVDLA